MARPTGIYFYILICCCAIHDVEFCYFFQKKVIIVGWEILIIFQSGSNPDLGAKNKVYSRIHAEFLVLYERETDMV